MLQSKDSMLRACAPTDDGVPGALNAQGLDDCLHARLLLSGAHLTGHAQHGGIVQCFPYCQALIQKIVLQRHQMHHSDIVELRLQGHGRCLGKVPETFAQQGGLAVHSRTRLDRVRPIYDPRPLSNMSGRGYHIGWPKEASH